MEKVILENIGCRKYAEVWQMQQAVFDALLRKKEERSEGRGKEEGTKYCGEGREKSGERQCRNNETIGSGVEPEPSPPQVLILCEHPHVYTLGRSGKVSNLLVDQAFLQKIEAEYFRSDRGGDVTYHGFGQLVGYPVLDLERLKLSLRAYIHALEESIILTVAEYGIAGSRLEGATGVWIEADTPRARKIAAIGVKASRYVTMHGFSLNVSPDMQYYSYINPCGFTDRGVTSIERERGVRPPLEEVARHYAAHFENVFELKLK